MLVLASILLGTFIFYAAFFTDNVKDDDDDNMDGGMMIPAYNPI